MSDSARYAFGVATLTAILAGLGLAGWLGPPWPLAVGLILVEIGALAAGIVEGKTTRARLLAALSYAVFGATSAAASIWYVQGRSSIINFELFVPLLIALVPFAIVRLLVWLATRKRAVAPASSFGAADAALVAVVLAIPVAAWAVGSGTVRGVQAKTAAASVRHTVTFEIDAQGIVSYHGETVGVGQIRNICREAKAQDPSATLIVKTPRGVANSAPQMRGPLGTVITAGVAAGVEVNQLPEQ
jgi:hypothetical protein